MVAWNGLNFGTYCNGHGLFPSLQLNFQKNLLIWLIHNMSSNMGQSSWENKQVIWDKRSTLGPCLCNYLKTTNVLLSPVSRMFQSNHMYPP